MAAAEEEFDDGFECLLPSQFLTDEDILLDFVGEADGGGKFGGNDDEFGGSSLFFSVFDSSSKSTVGSFVRSDLSSPVDSASGIWGTEMEGTCCASEEDIFNLPGLTRRFARSSIDDHIPNSKSWGFSRSPQSTLSGEFGGCCDCRLASSSSRSPSLLSPAMAGKGRDAALHLLRAAAGEVAVMRSRREGTGFFSPRTPKSFSSYPFHKEKKPVDGQVNALGSRKIDVSCSQPSSPSSGWSRMRAVFLDSPGSKKECAGTGVFLPKPMDSPMKPSCSTVLIPAKVVQALNNLQNTQSNPPSPLPDFDVAMRTGERNDRDGIEQSSPRALGISNVKAQLTQE